ncbi:MAG: NAD(P)-binding domain-containing protein [Pseudomonadota bacterium]|nr:NAD(P)-binding domain-containing protein [Pseudomonadota bacterium]MEE3070609.1 NAD(P)-binding domain-containing protein [Pseudomonadota bacterium]
MKIAIIGAGNMGSAFARALAGTGATVLLGARDGAKAAGLAQDTGATVLTPNEAAAQADVVILALYYAQAQAFLAQVGDLSGKVLVDISNPITADFKDLVVGHTSSAAEELQAQVPAARVVKAFNTLFAGLIGPAARAGKTVQTFVAGDDAHAVAQVSEIAKLIGLTPVAAGPLRNARFIEPTGMLNIQLGAFQGLGTSVAPVWA